ncbi:MAG: hypothetical protein LBO06_03165 [Bacteroidales bacterium]|jgi:hypothetical protein|nr:hypothetical protein [Bacteroidales bacterium]
MKRANEIIITKLEDFIAKYYKNKAIRGGIYSAIGLIIFFLGFNIMEFYGYNSSVVRTVIFWCYIVLAIGVAVCLIGYPIVKIWLGRRRLSYAEAAKMIGKFFPEIDDKLLNLLELKQQLSETDNQLLEASIKQKTSSLSPIPFVKAIDKTKTRKYGKGLCITLLAFGIIALSFPQLISEPTHRYIKHSDYFSKPSPFSFLLQTKRLEVVQQADFEVVVKIEGSALPSEANIVIEGQTYIMKRIDKTTFSYNIKQLQRDMSFFFEAVGVKSQTYVLKVNPKPIIIDIETEVVYPAYTKLPSERLTSASNISVPKGSVIKWAIRTRDTKKVIVDMGERQTALAIDKAGRTKYEVRAMKDFAFVLLSLNDFVNYSDSLSFAVSVIEDLYPQIAVIEQRDSVLPQEIFFRGQIKDDYGFTKLNFNISVFASDDAKPCITKTEAITINNQTQAQEFYFQYDLSQIKLAAGERATYYFEVWDNDGVAGNKSTKSTAFVLELPTEKELREDLERQNEQIKSQSNQTLDEMKKIKQEIEALQKRLLEKRSPDWQDSKQIKDLLNQQQELKQRIEKITQQIKENNSLEQQLSPQEQEMIDKEKEIEKLFEQLMNEDVKKAMQELEKMMQKQMNKDEMQQALEQMKLSNEEINKQLDKNLELYKRLEIEKKANEIIDKLNELSQQQNELSQQPKQDVKQQEQISQDFKDIRKDLDEIQKKSSELSEPQNIQRNQQNEEKIQQNQKSAEQNLNKGNRKQAQQQQKQAAEDMKQMADELEQSMEQADEEQLAEDINEVRQILKNLITLSKQQESLISKSKNTSVSDPLYQKIINEQNNIKEDMKLISDSLFAMSKRQPQITNFINKELSLIDLNLSKSIENLLKYNQSMYASYKNPSASNFQQYAMTSINNLALLLAESLNNMQQQQNKQKSQSKSSKGKPQQSCDNPGNSNNSKSPSPKSMRQMQEALNKEIERLKKELEGQKPQQQGGKPKIGEGSQMNEELARAAAQQEAIRKMMQQYADQQKQAGGKAAGDLSDLLKQMEQVEKDIVNKNITQQTLNRQKTITTRLLQHEKAEQKREQEQRRQSQSGIDKPQQNNANFEEFNKLKKRELELLKQIPPVFTPYYKSKVDSYFYTI